MSTLFPMSAQEAAATAAPRSGVQIDPRSDPYFGPVDAGDGSLTMGGGNGGWMGALWDMFPEAVEYMPQGEGEVTRRLNRDKLIELLAQRGYKLMEANGADNGGHKDTSYRWIEDANGTVVATPETITEDPYGDLRKAAMVIGGGYAAGGGFGTTGVLGGAATGAGQAGLTTLVATGDDTAAWRAAAVGGAVGGARGYANAGVPAGGGGATQSTPLNMATIESGLGTPGYGINAAAHNSGLFDPLLNGAGAGQMFGDASTGAYPHAPVAYDPNVISAGGSAFDAANNIPTNPGNVSSAPATPTTPTPTTPAAPNTPATGRELSTGDWINLGVRTAGTIGALVAGGDDDSGGTPTGPGTTPDPGTVDPVTGVRTGSASAAAANNIDAGQAALNWFKEQWEAQAPARAETARIANETATEQLAGARMANTNARDLGNYYRDTFVPVQQRIVREATEYDTPGRRMAAAASAAADVDVGAAATRAATNRALGRAGIAPGTTKHMALQEDAALGQGIARGQAQTNAVRNVETTGNARMHAAANLGANLPALAAQQQQVGILGGNAAVASANTGLEATQSGNRLGEVAFNTALNANTSAGNLYNGVASNAIQASNTAIRATESDRANDRANDTNLINGIASLGTLAGNLYDAYNRPSSDVNVKKGTGRMANSAKALKQVEKTPVHEGWQYDPAKGGPDDGGRQRTGPMAQDVRRTMGEAAAPGGKVLDMVTINGRMMAAVQELSKRVKALEKAA